MKKTIDQVEFVAEFNGTQYESNFSIEGRRALFDYLEDLEFMDEEIEMDIVSLCCDYTEYDSAWDAMEQYQPEDMPTEGEEGDDLVEIQAKNERAANEWLGERTTVIPVEGGKVIIHNF